MMIPTSITDNIKKDLQLRNFTIYGQRLGILGIAILWLSEASWLFHPSFPSYAHITFFYIFKTLMILLFYPLAILTLEAPHLVPRNPFTYLSVASWFALPLCYIFTNSSFMSTFQFPAAFEIVLLLPTPWILGLAITLCVSRMPGTIVRGILYAFYALDMGIWTQDVGFLSTAEWHAGRDGSLGLTWVGRSVWGVGSSVVVSGVFAGAAVMYVVATVRLQGWVGSRVLGGSGVEPMALMRLREGPLYQSVEDETEGRIRLV
ncbi:hypothetical protein BU24DRAFT_491973 [Aaosphaeria arxii CBS 175.79]|uniref:Uncharacterized protein n=1 Tax=Aaosphaeria arxii CBS 175.79 TaxID=1450172 RepID=A0A6A5XU42_9PLEO|nr:uncharacterized protein BU24DRAFT_491973 [Aaosphaeria arxii CBS 175.79]KAF2015764.1 hypothetical protein BU24DRAFT_491973 [Aaosphaeria arxii CBS 175.79]